MGAIRGHHLWRRYRRGALYITPDNWGEHMSDSTGTDPTTTDPGAIVAEVGRAWWLLTLFGVITIGFGIVLTFRPSTSVHAIAVLFGIWLLILGAVRLIQAIGASGERLGLLVVGLLSILVAILLLHHTTTTIATLGFIVGIFWTIGGLAQLFSGFTHGEDGRTSWFVVLMGVISTAIGILCLVYPSLSLSIICVIVGLGMILYGIVELLVSFQVRKLRHG
jgi:uncharacterized membrane protein HdeD (DUF308 family)